jgi:hypothetical protein
MNRICTYLAAGFAALLIASSAATLAGTPDGSQTTPNAGVFVWTPDTTATVTDASQTRDVLLFVGSPENFRFDRPVLEQMAREHPKLFVVYADPEHTPAANDLLDLLVQKPHNFPMVVFIGDVIMSISLAIPEHMAPDMTAQMPPSAIANLVKNGLNWKRPQTP